MKEKNYHNPTASVFENIGLIKTKSLIFMA